VIYSIFAFGSALWLAWWILVCAMCFVLYRAVRLPVLPWIGFYYAVGIIAIPVMQYYGHRIAQSGQGPEVTSSGRLPDAFLHSPLALATSGATALDYAGDLLVLMLAFSEAAVLVGRVYPEVSSRLLRGLTGIHLHIRTIGLVAIILTALMPVPAMLYFYTHR
jgi:uncharacterized protein with PQ loop repeat